ATRPTIIAVVAAIFKFWTALLAFGLTLAEFFAVGGSIGTRTFFFARRFGGRSAIPGSQVMQERGGDVGATKAFFKQAFEQMILALEIAVLKRGADFIEKQIRLGAFHFFNGGRFAALNFRPGVALNVVDL